MIRVCLNACGPRQSLTQVQFRWTYNVDDVHMSWLSNPPPKQTLRLVNVWMSVHSDSLFGGGSQAVVMEWGGRWGLDGTRKRVHFRVSCIWGPSPLGNDGGEWKTCLWVSALMKLRYLGNENSPCMICWGLLLGALTFQNFLLALLSGQLAPTADTLRQRAAGPHSQQLQEGRGEC